MDSALGMPLSYFRWRVGRMRIGRRGLNASMTKSRILVVAEDASTRAILARWLIAAGYAVELAESSKRAREVVEHIAIALAILAPDGLGAAGAELAGELGGQVEHVLVIEPEGDGSSSASKIQGGGGIPRPLSEQAMLARVASALGAVSTTEQKPARELLCFEGYTLDAAGRTCIDASGQELELTRAELSLLLALARQPGRVLSRDELSQAVAGRGAEPDDRSVDVLMSRLRRKIEPDPKTPRIIVTLPGEGYKFTARPQVVLPAAPMTLSQSFTAPVVSGATHALGQDVASQHTAPPGREIAEAKARMAPNRHAPLAALVVVLVVAALAAATWTNRRALQQRTEGDPQTTSPVVAPSSTSSPADISEETRRATIFKRMVAAMQDTRFEWRTVERLAVDAGVNEAEAHEILAEHPGEVVLGESREGKLIARLPGR
jgi:DNA-binding response OmpR family regulator